MGGQGLQTPPQMTSEVGEGDRKEGGNDTETPPLPTDILKEGRKGGIQRGCEGSGGNRPEGPLPQK